MLYYTQKSSFVNSQKRKNSKISPFSRRNKLQHRFHLQIVGLDVIVHIDRVGGLRKQPPVGLFFYFSELFKCHFSAPQFSISWPPVTGRAWPVSYFCSTRYVMAQATSFGIQPRFMGTLLS